MIVFSDVPIYATSSYEESVGRIFGYVIAITIIVGFEVYWIASVIRAFKRGTFWSITLGCIGACGILVPLVAAAVYLITGTPFPGKSSPSTMRARQAISPLPKSKESRSENRGEEKRGNGR